MTNITNAWKLLHRNKVGCIGHTLNLAATKALGVNSAAQVVDRVKRLVSHFHYSPQSLQKLAEKQDLMKVLRCTLIQDMEIP